MKKSLFTILRNVLVEDVHGLFVELIISDASIETIRLMKQWTFDGNPLQVQDKPEEKHAFSLKKKSYQIHLDSFTRNISFS